MFFSKGIHEGFLFSTDNNHDGLNYITKNFMPINTFYNNYTF